MNESVINQINSQLQNLQTILKQLFVKNGLHSLSLLFSVSVQFESEWRGVAQNECTVDDEETNKNQSKAIRIIVMWRLFTNCINGKEMKEELIEESTKKNHFNRQLQDEEGEEEEEKHKILVLATNQKVK